ncbi:hypothetical protein GIB67_017261 [Kingdonia uniflora]|uniref:Uncharacterized protein n=1 Tax=Kingdonia uniflora TaxID=39325 RepID=A0A7J7NPE7_9MAGN|nr:hypothetical protein GIB67_017261 [Kingdonia uniflora]
MFVLEAGKGEKCLILQMGPILMLLASGMLWDGDLLDMQKFDTAGVDLYIRVADIKKCKGNYHSRITYRSCCVEKLASATNNFSVDNKLGEGGFGSEYKGTFSDGQEIAVKRLSKALDKAQWSSRMKS